MLSISGCGLFTQGNDKETLVIGATPWSSTIPPTNIVATILEEHLDYDVQIQEVDVGTVYSGLATGDIDIFVDAWLPNMHGNYMQEYGDRIDEISVSYTEGILGWVVPTDSKVESIAELNDYRDEFGGQIIGIDAGAGMMETSQQIIDEYDLDYELVEGSEWAMLTEVSRQFDRGNSVLFLGWRPHWMFAEYDLKFLEDPKGLWQQDEVRNLATKGLAERAPEAVAFLKNWQMPIDDLEDMIRRMELENEDIDVLVAEWLQENESLVQEMLP